MARMLYCWISVSQQYTKLLEGTHDETNGWEYNCFVDDKEENHRIPRLEETLVKRKAMIDGY
jgi:hypothetical protein